MLPNQKMSYAVSKYISQLMSLYSLIIVVSHDDTGGPKLITAHTVETMV